MLIIWNSRISSSFRFCYLSHSDVFLISDNPWMRTSSLIPSGPHLLYTGLDRDGMFHIFVPWESTSLFLSNGTRYWDRERQIVRTGWMNSPVLTGLEATRFRSSVPCWSNSQRGLSRAFSRILYHSLEISLMPRPYCSSWVILSANEFTTNISCCKTQLKHVCLWHSCWNIGVPAAQAPRSLIHSPTIDRTIASPSLIYSFNVLRFWVIRFHSVNDRFLEGLRYAK